MWSFGWFNLSVLEHVYDIRSVICRLHWRFLPACFVLFCFDLWNGYAKNWDSCLLHTKLGQDDEDN